MFAVVAAAGAASPEVGSGSVSVPAEEPLIAHFVLVCALPARECAASSCSAPPGQRLC